MWKHGAFWEREDLGVWLEYCVQGKGKGHGQGLKGASESWLPPD